MTISRSGESYAGLLSGDALQDALENSLDCVLVLDLAGTVQSVNPAGAQLLGENSPAAIVGKGWQGLWIAPDEAGAAAAMAAAAAGAPQRLVLGFPIRDQELR
ncbi:MAG TPA: PAS domain-containing protein, partial [Caulobacteraceae bacterium]|nr:PAS domain-containing protein [Caulobacteraceae bacterium]